MKKLFILALVAVSFAACQNSGKNNTTADNESTVHADHETVVSAGEPAVMSFETENYNFGKIAHGEKVSYSYKVKNVGKSPLIILNATATCGCTVPEIPEKPIKPGEEGEIKVVFDSQGKSGMQDKVITITSNGEPNIASLHLTGEIN